MRWESETESTWPEVSKAQFLAVVDHYDYVREGYVGSIVYKNKYTSDVLGYISDRDKPERYFLHPDMVI